MGEPTTYLELMECYNCYRESRTGKIMSAMIEKLNTIAKILLKRHDINCCSQQDTKHLKFQCGFSEEFLIKNYNRNCYIHYGFEEVEQFVVFMGASEIESFMVENYETCVVCKDLKDYVSSILNFCIESYSDNPYIIDYKERLINAQECTHNLQEPVEEEIDEPESSLDEKEEEIDEPESSLDEKEEESDEQKEEEWISYPCQPSNESNSLSLTLFDCPPCLPKEVECYVPVDSLEIFPMSKTCENNYATVIYDNPCYFDKSYDNALFVPDVEMHGTKEFCLANVYDKALDDGPMLLDNINCTTNENGIGDFLTYSMSPISLEIDQLPCYIINKSLKVFIPLFLNLIKIICLEIMRSMLHVIVILLSLFMKLLKIIMREENMVVEIFMLLKYLSMC